jgi:hypothetical protein
MKSTRADCGAFPENAHRIIDGLRRRTAEEFSNSSKIPLDESLRHEHGYLKVVFNGHGFHLVPSSKCGPPETTRH